MTETELEQQARNLYADQKPRPALRARLEQATLPRPMPSHRWVFALGGTLAVAGVTGGVFLTPRPVSALAGVEEALLKVNTVSWDTTMVVWNETGKETQRIAGRHILRLNPPAVHTETTLDTAGANAGTRVWTPEGSWGYDPQQRKYLILQASERDKKAETARMLAQNRQSILDPSAGNTRRNWKRTDATLHGRPVLKFMSEWTDRVKLYDGKGGTVPQKNVFTLWADPKTHLLLRTESETHSWRVGTRTVSENVHFDEPLPPETFSPRPPAGARCFVSPDPRKTSTPLSEAERPALLAAIGRIEKAWARRDSAALEAEFDFAYLPTLYANPSSSYSLHPFAEQQKGYWQKRLQALYKRFPTTDIQHWELTSANRVGALHASSAPLLYRPVGEPEWIKAEVEARTAGGMHVHRLFFRTLPDGTPRLFFAQLAEVQEGFPDPPGVFGE